ncbi:MAG: MarR family transcriptional regulator [Candidatus Omnitrophota bacterium]|jgi:DNA-binding MarR family transcriptional regulator
MGVHSISEFADKVSALMQVISKEFFKRQSGDFYKMKITMPQFVVLDVLNKGGVSRMSDLAHTLNVTTAAITGIVDRLVRGGYILRVNDPGDRRIVKVKLTAKGTAIAQKIVDHRKNMMKDMFGVISQEEREEYLKILTHIHDHIVEKNH